MRYRVGVLRYLGFFTAHWRDAVGMQFSVARELCFRLCSENPQRSKTTQRIIYPRRRRDDHDGHEHRDDQHNQDDQDHKNHQSLVGALKVQRLGHALPTTCRSCLKRTCN